MDVPNIFDCAEDGFRAGKLNPVKCTGGDCGGQTVPGGYVHTQAVPSLVWVVEHHLGWDPAGIIIRDATHTRQFPDEDYVTPGEVMTLTFPEELSGTAWVS